MTLKWLNAYSLPRGQPSHSELIRPHTPHAHLLTKPNRFITVSFRSGRLPAQPTDPGQRVYLLYNYGMQMATLGLLVPLWLAFAGHARKGGWDEGLKGEEAGISNYFPEATGHLQ